jgi:alpha-1,6-mannosyltransferase
MKAGALVAAALLCTSYLSTTLVRLGLDKVHYILASNRKFATFPNLSSQVEIGLSYLILMVLYLLWLFSRQPRDRDLSFGGVLWHASLFLLLAFLAFPLGDDIFLYLHAGLMNLGGANPFLIRAGDFTTALSPFVDWGQTSTYGPVSQLLFTLSAAVVPTSLVLAIYVYKAFCLGLHIFNGYGIWRLLAGPIRGKMALAYLVNPLLLMEQVGSGHVDVLVSTSLIVFTACLFKQRYQLAFAALWMGFLAKTVPLIWMPLLGVFLLRQRRWWQLAGMALLSVGLIAALYATVLPNLTAWTSLLNPGVAGQYQSSLQALVKFGLDLRRIFAPGAMMLTEEKQILLMVSRAALLGFALFYGWRLWRLWRRSASSAELLEEMGWVTLVLLLFATPWLMPWYVSVLLTIAALLPRAYLFGMTTLAFGLSSSAQYVLQGHDSLKSLVAIAIPLLVWLVGRSLLARSHPELPALPTSPPDRKPNSLAS